ncbi:hypothetical protein HHL16_04335 [Pseudoflavitalea sp. G-6-1-2]|uniref:hypothetical protein n=1 Tax=Pseudoflavitalea sp. G-6-1-2 TaxID=2728841 RepID=UPI00146F5447|nr:hypothetical protein [Pseudoflavitalea sp. G-6-1-2]NML20087.1 hypothetical protein [Pseudoflavitalea sp. G-6-1-2]
MNQSHLRCIFAALTFFLFISCKTKQLAADASRSLNNKKSSVLTGAAADNGPQFTGREVPLDDARPCIELYNQIMAEHGFVLDPKGKVTLEVMQRKITTNVTFDGERMIEWMQRMLKAFPGEPASNIGFRVYPGYVDQAFLKRVGEDPANWPFRENRISIFVVPSVKNQPSPLNLAMRNHKAGPADMQTKPTVYELGGVEP